MAHPVRRSAHTPLEYPLKSNKEVVGSNPKCISFVGECVCVCVCVCVSDLFIYLQILST